MRLFVAVELPPLLLELIETQVVEPLRQILTEARWTRPESRHVTLKFLGHVTEDRIPEIQGKLQEAAGGQGTFQAAFAEMNGFPSLRRPGVLHLPIGRGSAQLSNLAARVDRNLKPLGFKAESRPYHPHLTVARFKVPKQIHTLPPVVVPRNGFKLAGVVLFESLLRRAGSEYRVISKHQLDC